MIVFMRILMTTNEEIKEEIDKELKKYYDENNYDLSYNQTIHLAIQKTKQKMAEELITEIENKFKVIHKSKGEERGYSISISRKEWEIIKSKS